MLPFYAALVPSDTDLVVPAALIGEPARAAMLLALMDGRSRPAGELARAIEALQALAPPLPVRSLRAARTSTALGFARTCYDHLAGELAVALAAALVDRGVIAALEPGVVGTLLQPRHEMLALLGVGAAPVAGRRPVVRGCLDWTQRVPHLAGGLGALVLTGVTRQGWIVPTAHSRAVRLTDEGRQALTEAALFSDGLLVA